MDGLYDDIAMQEKANTPARNAVDSTYDALAAGEADQKRNALKASINVATQFSPDAAGKVQALSDRSGLPLPVVERNEAYIDQQQRARDLRSAMQDSPVLARQMLDPNFAKIAQDDVPQLNAFMKGVRSLQGMLRGAAAGLTYDTASGLYGLGEVAMKNLVPLGDAITGTILPENPLRRVAAGLEALRRSAAEAANVISGSVPEAPQGGFIEQAVVSGFRSTGQMAPGLAMSIATRDPKYVLAMGGGMAGSQSATKALDAGASPGKALIYGLEDAVAEVVTEKLPMGVLLKDLNAGASFQRVLAHQFATEVPTELAATAWQNANEWANLNPDKTFGEYIKELGPDAAQTVIATMTQVVLTAGLGKVGHHVLTNRVQELQANQDAEQLTQLLAAAGVSRTRERSPQKFSEFVADASNDGPVDAVYVNAAQFAQGAQEAGINIATMPQTAVDLKEALATNRDVRIPLNEFATTIPGTSLEQAIIPHLRTDPSAPTQQEASDAAWIEQTQAQTEKILAENQFADTWKESAANVEKELLAQLSEVGRFTPDVNRAYAQFMSAFYSTNAHRIGITPEEMYTRYPLQIRAEQVTGSGAGFGQQQQGEAPATVLVNNFVAPPGVEIRLAKEDTYGANNAVALQWIERKSAEKGAGAAALNQLAAHADELGVTIKLAVTSKDERAKLVPYYRQFGFKKLIERGGDYLMYRLPQTLDQSIKAEDRTVEVDGVRRPITNSNGQLIAPTLEAQIAFWKWFGDSKVVDENGKPLVVYHGTNADIAQFNPNSHFGTQQAADDRAEALRSFSVDVVKREPGTFAAVPVYLRIDNPLRMPDLASLNDEGKPIDPESDEYARGWESDEAVAMTLLERGEFDIDDFEAGRNNDEAFKILQEEKGYDGIVYANVVEDAGSDSYIVFNPEQIKSAVGNSGTFDGGSASILDQESRGRIKFPSPDIKQQAPIMSLLARADLSTFLHESGHFYLEVLADMARQPNAPQEIVDDFNAAMKWFGVTPEQWHGFDIEQKREYHEKWARGFESYLFEGKAPAAALTTLFGRFRAWMVNVYQQLAALNVTLNDEVRAVFDRLIATNNEIIEAEAARAYAPIFEVKPDGVTDDEWKAYQEQQLDATQEAVDQLQTRSLRDMQWLTGARSRALKKLQKQAEEKRQSVRAEVAAEVDAQPIYAAARGLKNGWTQDDGTKLMVKFNTNALKELYPEGMVDRPDLDKLKGMTNAETGMQPDEVAGLTGFDSGDELIRKLVNLEPRVNVVEGMTDQRMLERYGDLADPQSIEKAANEAVHNDVRARVLSTELAMLSKAVGDKNLLNKAAKEFAAQIIARQRLKDLKPRVYAAAEARAGRAADVAMKKNDLQTAAAQKRTQVVNMHATKAAYDAADEVRKGMDTLRKVLKGTNEDIAKTRDVDVVMAARAVLAEYGIGKKGKAAQEYLAAVKAYDPGMYDVLRDRVDALTQNAKPVDQLTLDEFRALRDEIGSMMHLARRSRQMEVDGDLMDRTDVQDELYARMEAIGIPDKMPGSEHAVTDAERRLAKFQTARAALRRVESWVGVKDGKQLFGPFRKYVWSQIKDAADLYRSDKAKLLKQYRSMLDAIAPSLKPSRIAAPELGYTFGFSRGGSGTAELLHAILHTGNASNKRKLLLGRKWASEDAEGNLDTSRWDAFLARMIAEGRITKAHYDFAQAVWNMFEGTKPLAQKTHRDVFGYYFNEISAEKFKTPFGEYAGGYVPAIADPEIVTDAKTRALMEEENTSMQFAFPSTNKGFTKGRVEYNRPLLLDLRVMSQHLDKVLLFSHLEQPVRDVRRVLTSKKVAYAMNRIDPAAFDGLLTPWLNRTAHQQVETPVAGSGGLMRFFSVVRSRAGMAAMFANLSNTVQQITGFSTAAVKVKPKYLMSAMADYIAHPRDFVRAVADSSVYMEGRIENEVGQMTDAINDVLLNPSVYEKATSWTAKHAYFLQSAVDNVIGPIVWTGAYNEALETLPADVKDEQRVKQARRLADSAVRETQGAMQPEEVSRIETGNAFVRLFTQFAGYFNTQANMLGTEFAKLSQDVGLKKGAGRGLYILLLGFLAPAWVSEMIAQAFKGGPDDEDKDGSYLDDWLAAVFGFGALRYGTAMVPVVGQVVNAGVNTLNKKPYDDRISTAPAISMIESAVSAPHSIYKAIVDDGKPSKAIKDVAALISLMLGVPASFIARPVSYLADVAANRVTPTSPVDAVRGTVTGAASPESKNR